MPLVESPPSRLSLVRYFQIGTSPGTSDLCSTAPKHVQTRNGHQQPLGFRGTDCNSGQNNVDGLMQSFSLKEYGMDTM